MARTSQPSEPWQATDVPGLRTGRRLLRAVLSPDVRFRAYFRVVDTPVLSELYVRGRGRLRRRRIQPRTRLVLEAFPSSASTFCRQAMLLANPDLEPDDICSHTHAPRVVQRAVRRGLPCIVVVRDPQDAVSSLVQRFHGVEVETAFAYYTRYYGTLLPLTSAFVVAPFDIVTTDFASVVRACNERYGTTFAAPQEAGVSDDEVRADAERRLAVMRNAPPGSSAPPPRRPARQKAADFLADRSEAEDRALQEAVAVYRSFVDQPPGSRGPGEPAA